MTTSIDTELQKKIKKLAIDLEKPLNVILEDAIKDYLRKHGKDPD